MNKNIGFILINLLNDVTYDHILQQIKKFEQNNIFGHTVIFNSFCNKVETYQLPILHLSQAQFFEGSVFIFDLPSILMTSKFPNYNKRILYTNNIPWMQNPKSFYAEWESLYQQNNLDILVTNQNLYDAYSLCWKKPIGIAEVFSYEQLSKFI